jgi:hypothetical protein
LARIKKETKISLIQVIIGYMYNMDQDVLSVSFNIKAVKGRLAKLSMQQLRNYCDSLMGRTPRLF